MFLKQLNIMIQKHDYFYTKIQHEFNYYTDVQLNHYLTIIEKKKILKLIKKM